MLVACGLALAAGCSGSGSDGATPVVDIGACSGNACGTLLIGLTAADGDFVSYSVDVFSVTFERRNGAVVETLPAATRVDFAHAYAGHGFAVARDSRSRRLRPRHDPPRLHECLGVRRGRRRSRESHDRRDAPLGVTEVDVRLANGNHVVVTRGRAAFRALDFDLAASHDVDVAQSPPVVITRPYIAAEVQPIHEKELRVRGALVDVDTAGASYTVDVRPWYRRDGNHGRLTIATTSTTAFEIDGVGEALSIVGYINAYGAAPPDFDGRTVVDRRDLPATIGIGWRSDGTLAPFVSVGALGLVLDLMNPQIGARRSLLVGMRRIDLLDLPASPTIAPARGRTLFGVSTGGQIELLATFDDTLVDGAELDRAPPLLFCRRVCAVAYGSALRRGLVRRPSWRSASHCRSHPRSCFQPSLRMRRTASARHR